MSKATHLLRRISPLRRAVRRARQLRAARTFAGSQRYWEDTYRRGGTSGPGSYGRLASYKAEVLNDFVTRNGVATVVELGCGDGEQLALAAYPRYIGLDVSPTALGWCIDRFIDDLSKSFLLYDSTCFRDPLGVIRGDLALSIDVLYHLVEEHVFVEYLNHLFDIADRFVIIYAVDEDIDFFEAYSQPRRFIPWVEANRPEWALIERISNPYGHGEAGPDSAEPTTWSEFFIFERQPPR